MADKPVVWLGSSLEDVGAFPNQARREVGYQLYRVQQGLLPDDWKPLRTVGSGVVEIRVHAGGAFRVLYVTKYPEAVYVLHAFEKKTQKTRPADLDLARRRLAALVERRRNQ